MHPEKGQFKVNGASEDLSWWSIREAKVHYKFEANISNAWDHAICVGQKLSMVGQ